MKKNIKVIIFFVSLLVVYGIFVGVSKSEENFNSSVLEEDIFNIQGVENLKLNGKSIIGKEQKIFVEPENGDISEVNVINKQKVNVGDILFSYYNIEIESELDNLKNKIEKNNNKKIAIYNDKNAIIEEINSYNEQIKNKNAVQELNNIVNKEEINEAVEEINEEGNEKEIEIDNEVEVFNNKIEELNLELNSINEILNEVEEENSEIEIEIKKLKDSLITNVKADIDGIVYLNENALYDNTEVFIRIISEEGFIKGEATEFNVDLLEVQSDVLIRNITTSEYIKGKIVYINDLPKEESGESIATYNFYIDPEKELRIGATVQIICNYKNINIPEEYIYCLDEKMYLCSLNNEKYELIEADIFYENNNYYLINSSVGIGTDIVKNFYKYVDGES